MMAPPRSLLVAGVFASFILTLGTLNLSFNLTKYRVPVHDIPNVQRGSLLKHHKTNSRTIVAGSVLSRDKSAELKHDTAQDPESLRIAQEILPPQVPASPFQRHVLATYQSAINDSNSKPKFLLFRMNACGWGNTVRSLIGAVFVATMTDRVLIVDTPRLLALFNPPVVDGVEIGWNPSAIDKENVCNRTDAVQIKIDIPYNKRNVGIYASKFIKFDLRYGTASKASPDCLIYDQPYGWDRLVATYNEAEYLEKVRRLFGKGKSRFNWSKLILGWYLSRPKKEVVDATKSFLNGLGLSALPMSRRMGVHVRTFVDFAPGNNKTLGVIQNGPFWPCIRKLVSEGVVQINQERRGQIQSSNDTASTDSNMKLDRIKILFLSDMRKTIVMEAKRQLADIDGIDIIWSSLSMHHTAHRDASDADVSEVAISHYLEWLALGEVGTLIASGWSSFGMTAFFRPSIDSIVLRERQTENKLLYTVDNLEEYYTTTGNPSCGQVLPKEYDDVNFGWADPQNFLNSGVIIKA